MSFSNQDVVTRWMQCNLGIEVPKRVRRTSAEGSSTKFRGPVFYSWRTPIAKFTTDKLNKQVILLCDTRYSTSTTTHQGLVSGTAFRFKAEVYSVHWIGVPGELNHLCPEDFHAGNVEYMLVELMERGALIGRNGHITEGHYRWADDNWPKEITIEWNAISRYADAFGKRKHLPALNTILETIRRWRKKRYAEWNEPKRKARRDAYAARKNALKAFGLEEYKEPRP